MAVGNVWYPVSFLCSPTYICNMNLQCNFPPFQSYCFNTTEKGLCLQFCEASCGSCHLSAANCTSCRFSNLYELSSNSSGTCAMRTEARAIVVAAASAQTLKISGLQLVYMFIDRLDLYIYHDVEYEGLLYQAITFASTAKEACWNMLSSVDVVRQQIAQPFGLPSYLAYTDFKFQQVERSDCLLVQNTKEYFLIYLPVSLAVFVLLNRLFHCMARFRLSALLRAYSFWLQIWLIAVAQNLTQLWFYCMKELTVLFSLNCQMVFVRMFTVPTIGLIFVGSICLFPLCAYLYGSNSKYFYINIRPSCVASPAYMLTRFVLKPLFETSLTVLLQQNVRLLLCCLIVCSLVALLLLLFVQVVFGIH